MSNEQRVDRWLWFTRLIKSRTQAADLVSAGKVRLNGERISKPSRSIKPDDVLTFALGEHVRVLKVLNPGTRRGPASEARLLYEDLAPIAPKVPSDEMPAAERERGSGRPTKKERRDTDTFHNFNDRD
jgi:ribosome-associated heat shock protein Hsp15